MRLQVTQEIRAKNQVETKPLTKNYYTNVRMP